MSDLARVLLYSAAWATFGVVSGWLVTRIPARRLAADRGLLRLWGFEQRGRVYERWTGVRRWKGWLPDAGSWFGGPPKARLASLDHAALVSYARETRRAEIVHWANAGFGPTFFLWQSWEIGLVMTVFGLVVHLPFVVVQRYNRARVIHVLERSRRRVSSAAQVAGTAPSEVPTALPTAARPRRRRRGLAVGGLLLAGTGGFLAGGWLSQEKGRPGTVDEAAAQFERGNRAGGGPGVPAEGVYRYTGSGTERLSVPPVRQDQGPEMPATVTHLDGGCWRFRIDYSTNHWQHWDYCATDKGLVERGGGSFQRLNLVAISVDVTTATECTDAVAIDLSGAEGQALEQACTVSDEKAVTGASTGRNVFLGREDAEVGGATVPVLHYRRERDLSGRQRGTEEVEVWFDAETFLPVRVERRIAIETDTPLGALAYEEQGDFQLQSIEPVG